MSGDAPDRRHEGPLHDWKSLNEEGLRSFAGQYVGWATNEMGDPAELAWRLEVQFPLSEFLAMRTDWSEYHRDEILENPRYRGFDDAEFHTPVVVSSEHDELIIWDGWHRIACAIARGDECIMAIFGTEARRP